ncbi:MAG: DNA processing protein, partial [Planctomycetota bacterium]
SRGLARAGVVVVSGLARGIDQASHAAALDAGGATIAVVGSGLDRLWPRGPVTDRVECEGLLLSEYSPGTPPRRHHFPLRNRLIAALSLGVVVVEAAARSGSLITARWALDMGREVLAVPGRVDHPMARGAHRLLREGATLVESPADILEALELKLGATEEESTLPEEPLLRALVGETLSPEELAQQLNNPLPQVLADLALLDLDGRVARVPGGLYRLVQRP